ncbi:endoglucanase II [Verticillium dahliae VdLs.17]|uniref:lytic cellulose monooxygenase (C4-dehydrogenating) n=1 Tax=Verticillium dahliae (strain VdLs.17 / ATCC MYA-4575 / FGSC 10137) TaxID=498257 RepID=G2WWT2_VERDV|nr:endoglucanase II [Verticillium dahliae VdLs.17]EGY21187.1 endoglucanase II [Verticillium dahliae VdLs.17]KAH6707169.1 endoglucanase II [Verticillium dahliae]
MAHGHATFQQFWIDGVDQGSICARLPPGNSPIEDVTSNNLRCNIGGASGVAGICEVPGMSICPCHPSAQADTRTPAGSMIEVEMHEQPGDRDCEKPAIGGNHHGPVMVYLAAVHDATTADGSDPFFKIGEYGYTPEDQVWGTDYLNNNCGRFGVLIPENLPSGDYLVRAEAVALHSAGQLGAAQFYMTCYQIKVTNGGTASIPSGVSFPGEYKADHPGIHINIWVDDIDAYVIPGPPIAEV